MENVENTISEPLDFKMFLGRMPQDRSSNSRLRRSFSSPHPSPPPPPRPPVENRLRRPCNSTYFSLMMFLTSRLFYLVSQLKNVLFFFSVFVRNNFA